MCGITGYWNKAGVNEAVVAHMAAQIQSRGPDDAGIWLNGDHSLALAHRRLSIVDLSAAGHQPMVSVSGRYVIVFNGEIYNYLELRKSLDTLSEKSISWCGHSDTETLLAGFDAWGIKGAVVRSTGMFAFAVWDKQDKALVLGRDRLGEKPLYYGWQGNSFLFGSELKALKKHPDFQGRIDRGAISLLVRHSYIPAPHSIYQGIHKLLPGCLLTITKNNREPKIESYWSVTDAVKSGMEDQFSGSPEEAVDELERLAKNAVSQQMMSDVPLGAFLSGGVDSSTVVALMQAQSSRPVKTFSIGFHEENYNEAVHAKAVAKYLGTEHTELYVNSEQAMAVVPKLPDLYCEPFSDPSQIPTFIVSQLAKQHVTVSLSGDGGDELFCGYNRYQMTANLWKKISRIPISLRKVAAKGMTCISPHSWDYVSSLIPGRARVVNFGDKLHKGASVLASDSVPELYLGLVSHHKNPGSLVINGREPPTFLTGNKPDFSGLDDVQCMMALDMMTYLPDDILVKVDRASMGVSLESRVPFLDHQLVEFAWRLPLSIKLRDGQSKWPLRQVLYRHVLRELIERPKMGFAIPLGDWLRGPLREWSEALLEQSRLQQEGFFDAAQVRNLWLEHLSKKRNWAYLLWNILMFQAWFETQKN